MSTPINEQLVLDEFNKCKQEFENYNNSRQQQMEYDHTNYLNNIQNPTLNLQDNLYQNDLYQGDLSTKIQNLYIPDKKKINYSEHENGIINPKKQVHTRSTVNKIKTIDDSISLHLKQMKVSMLPTYANTGTKIIVSSIRLIQIILIIFILFGWILPKKFLKYHLTLCIIAFILWEFTNNKSLISLITQKVSMSVPYRELVPINSDIRNRIVILCACLTIYSLLVPDKSIFNLISIGIDKLKKFN